MRAKVKEGKDLTLEDKRLKEPTVIERILAHLKGKEPSTEPVMLPEDRAPPQARLFD